MADLVQFLLIIFPFALAIFLLVVKRWKADTTGIIVWTLISSIAFLFSTSISDIFVISVAGYLSQILTHHLL